MDTNIAAKVFAVVVTHNGEHLVDRCINSLQQSSVPVQVIVVDNNSADGTIQLVKKKYSAVEIIRAERNLGFGKANNIGMITALNQQADYIFLLNQDAWVAEECIAELIKIHKAYAGFGVISPAHYNSATRSLDKQFELHLKRQGIELGTGLPGGVNNLKVINFINAAAWLLPAACLKIAGGFDPVFPHYTEDLDFCNRLRYHGFKTGIYFPASAYHERCQEATAYDLMPAAERKSRKFFEYMAEWKNINQPLIAAAAQSIFRQLKTIARYCLTGQLTFAAEEFAIAMRLAKGTKTIIRHRQISKLVTSPFLAASHTNPKAFFP